MYVYVMSLLAES